VKHERNPATPRHAQKAFGGNDISPNIVADEQNTGTTSEMLSSPISFSSVGEIENGQSLGLENSCLRRLLCEYSDNSKIKSTAGSTAPSARSTTTDTSSSTTTSSALSTCRKRVVADEDDDSLPDEHNGGSKRPKNGPRPWPKIDQRLACPFRKRDPHKYNIHAHRVCASRGWDSISRVKFV
jgi:hypothetical protein